MVRCRTTHRSRGRSKIRPALRSEERDIVSHKHLSLLHTIFQDPLSSNIHWREVESLLRHLGASIEPTHGARFRVVLNQAEGFLHHPHNSNVCDKQSIKLLREFLVHAGVSPSNYEEGKD